MLLVGAGSQAQPAAERAFGPSALRRLLDCATELTGHIPLVLQGEGTYLAGLGLMGLAAFGTLFICGGIQGYQVFVGDFCRGRHGMAAARAPCCRWFCNRHAGRRYQAWQMVILGLSILSPYDLGRVVTATARPALAATCVGRTAEIDRANRSS